MYAIFVLLALVLIHYCRRLIPTHLEEWWDNSNLKKWLYPIFMIVITVAVALGIEFDVLNWGAVIIPILLGFPYIVGMILGVWHNMKRAGHKLTSKDDTDAKEIAVKCLKGLGCNPEYYNNGSIVVKYQGESFLLEFGGRYVQVWDLMWATVKADDPDISKIREAVNITNFNFGPTVVLSSPDEKGIINFHSRRDIMLHPSCPDNVRFLSAVLDSFFDVKEEVRSRYQQINAEQEDTTKPHRPVGFATT